MDPFGLDRSGFWSNVWSGTWKGDLPRSESVIILLSPHGTVRNLEVKFRRKEGTEVECLITAATHTAEDGVLRYQGIIRDITEQKQNEQLRSENLRMETELGVAQRLQQMALPTEEELQAVEDLDIAAYMEPADEVGGDYYDVLQTRSLATSATGRVLLGMGDVTGHGLESGIVMLMTQTAVRTLLESGENDPVRFMDTLNRTIYQNVQRMEVDRSLTLCLIN